MAPSMPIFSDPIAVALIGMVGTFMTALMGVVTAYLTMKNARRLEATKVSVDSQKSTIAALEKNTNSIKDALVKVTAESEFAKGLKLGSDAAGGVPAGVAALTSDIQAKAAHAAGVADGIALERSRVASENIAAKKEQVP